MPLLGPLPDWRQRYLNWVEPLYLRLPPAAQDEARKLDRVMLQRPSALWGSLGALAGCLGGSTLALVGAGFPKHLAFVVSLLLCWGLAVAGLSAWLQPDRVLGPWGWRVMIKMALVAYLGAILGFVVGRVMRQGGLPVDEWVPLSLDAARRAWPVPALAALGTLMLMVLVAWARRQVLARELTELRLMSERDTAARQAAEARLKLLQGQIQPHFIFNTLSAVQHWVDSGDVRGAALLRELTAFLRGSTELLGRADVTLAEEAAMVGHYLAIMQGRLGDRLRSQVHIEPELALQRLPPGLLLTLVENAVEHGIAPALQGGEVQVRAALQADGWTLTIEDSGMGLNPQWQDGVGLANTRQRLAHAFGDRAELTITPQAQGTAACIHVRLA
jgi:hypothetical protein